MKVVDNILQLPKKFRLFNVKNYAEAQQIASTINHVDAWFIDRKDYKASSAYLIIVVEA